jgi:hypothetical protein
MDLLQKKNDIQNEPPFKQLKLFFYTKIHSKMRPISNLSK